MSNIPNAHLTLDGELAKAIHAVRSAGITVEKTSTTGKFKFAGYVDVWPALRPVLAQHSLSVALGNTAVRMSHEGEVLSADLIISNGAHEARERYEVLLPETIRNQSGAAVTNSSQRTGGAQSYLKRIALIAYFNISTGTEDEVERMTPRPGENNIPGLCTVTDATPWTELTDGTWRDVLSPLGGYKLEADAEKGLKHMNAIWQTYPDHKGLMAFWADYINETLTNCEMLWADIVEKVPDLPGRLTDCTTRDQLASACRFLNELRKSKSGKEGK